MPKSCPRHGQSAIVGIAPRRRRGIDEGRGAWRAASMRAAGKSRPSVGKSDRAGQPESGRELQAGVGRVLHDGTQYDTFIAYERVAIRRANMQNGEERIFAYVYA